MSFSSGQELDDRIHNFLQSKLKKFPDIENINTEYARNSDAYLNQQGTANKQL